MKLPISLALSAIAWIGAAAPAAAQLGIDVSVGGASVGGEVGSGGASASVSAGGGNETPPGETLSPQDSALEAVRTDRALPLDQIIARAGEITEGEVIDAQLITVRGFLIYELKVLEPTGDVVDLYFYARTGRAVRTQ
jgi:uncharacterized membrane protein YkoI